MNTGYDSDAYKFDPEYHRVASFFGLNPYEKNDFSTASKVSFVYEWAKHRAGSSDNSKIFTKINQLRRSLGVNTRGQLLLNELYKTVRLLDDKDIKTNAPAQTKGPSEKKLEEKVKRIQDKLDSEDKEQPQQQTQQPAPQQNSLSGYFSDYINNIGR